MAKHCLTIQRRATGMLYLRKAVPEALREIIGKREFVRSLGTREMSVARKRALLLCLEVEEQLEAARNVHPQPAPLGAQTNARAASTDTRQAAPAEAPSTPILSVCLESYLRERCLTAKTQELWRGAIKRFNELHGDLPVSTITREHCRAFKEALLELPSFMPNTVRVLPLPQILELAGDLPGPRLEGGSLNRYMAALTAVLTWCEHQGYIEANPSKRLKVNRKGRQQARLPFSLDELRRVFDIRLYPTRREPVRFWLPLLALWTGARLEELSQLRVADVRLMGDIEYLQVTDEGPLQTLKTQSSRRAIPLHPELRRLGFLDYVSQVRERGDDRLWTDLARWHGRWGTKTGRWFNDVYLRRVVGIRDSRVVFHSFRHSFKDACRAAGVPEDIHDALTGHSRGSVSRGYGLGVGAQIQRLSEAMASIQYPGLDLSPMYPKGCHSDAPETLSEAP